MAPEETIACEVCGTANRSDATECSQCGIRLTASRNAEEVERLLEEFIQAEPEPPAASAADESLDLDREEIAGLVDSIVVPPRPAKSATPRPRSAKPPAAVPAPRVATGFECPACGTAVSAEAAECPTCGARFVGDVAEAPASRRRGPVPASTTPAGEPTVSVSEPSVSRWSLLSGRLIDVVVGGTMAALVGTFLAFQMYSWAVIAANPIGLLLFLGIAAAGFGAGGILFRVSTSAIAQADRLVKDGRYEEAVPLYDRALRVGSRPAEAWTGRGVAFKRLGRLPEAMRCHDAALKIDPDNEIAWCNKGDLHFHTGRLDRAIECYDKALAARPKYAIAWNNKGAALARAGRYEEARACQDRAVELRPRYVAAWLNRGEVLARLGDREGAAQCLEHARSLGA